LFDTTYQIKSCFYLHYSWKPKLQDLISASTTKVKLAFISMKDSNLNLEAASVSEYVSTLKGMLLNRLINPRKIYVKKYASEINWK